MNKNIPIFDSLTHPTIDRNWILPRYTDSASIDQLKDEMKRANVKWTFAVGMEGIGNYSEKEYASFILKNRDNNIFPVAFFNPAKCRDGDLTGRLKKIKQVGFCGIKLHPRLAGFKIDNSLADVIKASDDLQLVTMLCTYPYSKNPASYFNPESLIELLYHSDESKLILLHAGAVRILEYMEIARAFDNILLDLSLTICKYEGSSIDDDISFMFNQFDKRICIGSDFPEYSLLYLRERFEFFSESLDDAKKMNIAHKNILAFCNLK